MGKTNYMNLNYGIDPDISIITNIGLDHMSILGDDLSLNVKKTIEHGENLIKQGCHGVVFFGSTGQSQLIQISEKLNCINELSKSNLNFNAQEDHLSAKVARLTQ